MEKVPMLKTLGNFQLKKIIPTEYEFLSLNYVL